MMRRRQADKGFGSKILRLCLVMWCCLPGVLFSQSDALAHLTDRHQLSSVSSSEPSVLVLHSYHHGFTWSDTISSGIRSAFEEQAAEVEVSFEFMDTRHIYPEEYFQELKELYRLKYAGRHIDVIIASDDQAFNFMMGLGQDVFPDVPVVFCSVSGFEPSMRQGRQLTGLQESIDIKATLDVALQLHPDTKEVAVVTDMTRTGRALKAKAESVFSRYESRVQFTYLEDLTIDELKHAASALSNETIVFLFIFSRDKAGRVFSHEHNLKILAKHCNVPIYGVWDLYLGYGIVGGMLTSGEAEGRMAAGMALHILNGEEASAIPLESSPTRYMFDYRQLARFGVKESQLPENSLVINKPPSFYKAHKGLAWGVVSALIVLVVIVAILAGNIAIRRRAEEALSKEKAFSDTTIDSLPGAFYLFDDQGKMLRWNKNLEIISGYSPQEISGMQPSDFFAAEDRSAIGKAIQGVFAKGENSIELDILSKDGRKTPHLWTARLVTFNHAPCVVGTGVDITERKRAEQALGESEATLKSIFRAAPTGIGLVSNRVLKRVNERICEMIGYSKEELLEQSARILYPSDEDFEYVGKEKYTQIRERGTGTVETRWQRKDGEVIDVLLSSTPLDSDDLSAGVTFTALDITERKHAEAALLQSEQRYRSVYDTAPLAFVLWDVECRVTAWNDQAKKIFGWSGEEVLGRNFFEFLIPEGARPRVKEVVSRLLRGEIEPDVVNENLTRDGEIILCQWSNAILRDGAHQIVGAISLGLDITEQQRAYEALRINEEKYRQLFEHAPSAIYEIDYKNRRFITFNDVVSVQTGYSRDELTQMDPFDLFTDYSLEVFQKRQGLLREGKDVATSQEYEIKKKDGTTMWGVFDIRYELEEGIPVKSSVVAHDVTERKEMERALKESEEKYRTLFNSAADVIVLVDTKGNLLDANKSFEEESGYSREEMVGKSVFTSGIITESSSAQAILHFTGLIHGQERAMFEIDGATKAGGVIPYELTAVPIKKDGRPVAVQAILRNISSRKAAEEVLRAEKEKFEVLVEKSPLAVSLIGEDGRNIYVNPKFVEMFGYTLEDIPSGRAWLDRAYPDPEYRHEVISAWKGDKRGSKTGEVRPRVFTVTCKDGSEKVIHFRPVSMHDGNELVIYEDITAQSRLEARLRQAQKMEAIGTLAGGIAHDFNNLLTPIIVHTEIAAHHLSKDSPVQHNLEKVSEAGYRARDLVKQILAFSRQSEPQRMPLHISPILKEALRLLRASLPTTVEIRKDLNTESDIIIADPIEIHQVMLNLCTNAAHAMRQGGGVLEVIVVDAEVGPGDVDQHPDMKPGSYVKLAVSDTGHGMDQAVMERIFDPFFTTKPPGEGTGMGLAVVHGIVKGYGGAITVESETGRGSTFHVYIPRAEGEMLKQTDPAGPVPAGHERILFVDDEEPMVDAVVPMLENLGYKVVPSTSSIEALETFGSQPDEFDLVITDQIMPKMTGMELARELLRIRPDLPIILCTGFSDQITEEGVKALGISKFLMKPIIVRDMARVIREVLDK